MYNFTKRIIEYNSSILNMTSNNWRTGHVGTENEVNGGVLVHFTDK